MNLINPIIYDYPTVSPTYVAPMTKKEEPKEEEIDMGVDFSFFSSDAAKDVRDYAPINGEPVKETKRKRKTVAKVDMDDRVDKPTNTTTDYSESYNETSNMLRSAIAQTDQLSSEIKGDLDAIRANKTLKNKYSYITDLSSSSASLISTKIQAIRELNNSITQSHKFTLDREKIDKGANQDNDDMRMMDLYSAFVNAPMGTYTPNVPSIQEGILGVNAAQANIGAISMAGETDVGTLTPEQYAMRMEKNPNLDTVVVFDSATGNRYFDVIDRITGASVPGIPRPDNFLLDDTTIDTRAGIARNRNLDKVWPLVQLNNPAGNIEY